METNNEAQPIATEARGCRIGAGAGLRAALAGLAVAALLTVGAASVFAADTEQSASPDASAVPTQTDSQQSADRGDCPNESE
jgi:hypothetical protein